MEETIARYQTEMEELQKSRKERLSGRLKRKRNECYRNRMPVLKIRSVPLKRHRQKKEKTRMARQELTDFRTSLMHWLPRNKKGKMARKMEKLKEKQERKKNKKNEQKAASFLNNRYS